jgi:SAM-dependent methyltransferase
MTGLSGQQAAESRLARLAARLASAHGDGRVRRLRVPVFDPQVMQRRRQLRAAADDIQRRVGAERFLEWFDRLYAEARGDAACIPWADLQPHPLLKGWLAAFGPHEGRALEVGCGLGDNAAALARAGYAVTAFDISPHAVAWARRRFGGLAIDWRVADLLHPPEEWREAFDLVHETYTLQSLPLALREKALVRLSDFLAPGGRLLLVCRARAEDVAPEGPPWPLAPSELLPLARAGLELEQSEPVILSGERDIPHLFLLWRRPERNG